MRWRALAGSASPMRQVWSGRSRARPKLARACVRRLRRKLGDAISQPTYILTESCVGYRMARQDEEWPARRTMRSWRGRSIAGPTPRSGRRWTGLRSSRRCRAAACDRGPLPRSRGAWLRNGSDGRPRHAHRTASGRTTSCNTARMPAGRSGSWTCWTSTPADARRAGFRGNSRRATCGRPLGTLPAPWHPPASSGPGTVLPSGSGPPGAGSPRPCAYCRVAPKVPTMSNCSKMPVASAWPGP